MKMFYRMQQFIKAITATVGKEEREWVKEYLTKEECILFFKLKVYEQRHCIDVAKILEERTNSQKEMIRLGLLHDIGKIVYPLNPIQKGVMVLLDQITKGSIKRCSQSKMVKCYYEHPNLGYKLLKEMGDYNEVFLGKIKNHHNQNIQDLDLNLLQEVDDLC